MASRGKKGSGPGLASAGRSGVASPSFRARLTASFQVLSAILAISAASDQVARSDSTSRRMLSSTLRKGESTASRPGDLLLDGMPMAMVQRIGGSAQPAQGMAQRVLPMADPTAESNPAKG